MDGCYDSPQVQGGAATVRAPGKEEAVVVGQTLFWRPLNNDGLGMFAGCVCLD